MSLGEEFASLSAREQQVLRLVAEGLQTAEIAKKLRRSPSTIDNQILSARRKLGNVERRQAARMFMAAWARHSIPNATLPISIPRGQSDESEQRIGVREERVLFETPDPKPLRMSGDAECREHLEAVRLVIQLALGLIVILSATPVLSASFKMFAAWVQQHR
jgi:DNA-binding CsgD family transcriptional regulator